MVMNAVLITQARKGSTRLPGKVLKKIQGMELLLIQLTRLKNSKRINKLLVATTNKARDHEIATLVKEWDFECFRGSENDVLDRYYQAILQLEFIPTWVVRITSDNPLIDPNLVDEVILFAQRENVDYVSNCLIEHYPDGQDIEVFKFSALKAAWEDAKIQSEREHVTPYIRNNSDVMGGKIFTAKNFPCEKDFSSIRMTVDEKQDFKLIKKLIGELGTDKSWREYTDYIIAHNLNKINSNIIRNEGYIKSLKNDLK